MPRPVRIAIFGNSYAEKIQLPALAHIENNEVVGIAGKDGAKARATAERFKIPYATDNWPELFDLEPDLAIISTPVDLHFDMVQNALEHGAAVLCEKPFTLDLLQAEELTELARGRLALIDHQLRWNPHRIRLRELVRSGFVGDVFHVRADLVLDSPVFLTRPHSWWFDAARGGGVLGALGSHMIDNILWTFGPIESVSARLETFIKERNDAQGRPRAVTSDDFAELWLRTTTGISISVTTSVVTPGTSRWLTEVSGSKGTLRIDMEDDLVGGLHGEDMAPIESGAQLVLPEAYGISASGAFAACEPLFLAAVVGAVSRGEHVLPEAATFEDGVANMRVLEAARKSAASGGVRVACT